jgi:serine/threonine-protein kinase
VKVPPVAGLDGGQALDKLRGDPFDFVVTTASTFDPNVSPGIALGTDPPALSEVDAGSPITLKISLGAGVIVPNVVGQSDGAATKALVGNFLDVRKVVSLVSDASQDGEVLKQSPAAGTRVAQASTVTITIGQTAATTHT